MRNRPIITISITLLLLAAVAGVLYAIFGHKVITTLYESQFIGAFHKNIGGQAGRPLSFYLEFADRMLFRCQMGCLVAVFALIFGSAKFTSARARNAVFFIFTYGFIYLLTYGLHLNTGLDSTNYISCAEHLSQGKGFYSTGFDQANYDEYVRTGVYRKPRDVRELHPYTHWGPLYPALMSVPIRFFGTSPNVVALLVNRLFFALLLTVMFAAITDIGRDRARYAAPVIAGLAIFFMPFGAVFNSVWTEITYTGLSVLAVYLLDRFYGSSDREEALLLAASGVAVSLCVLCKYMGIAVVLSGIMLIMIKGGLSGVMRKVRNCLIFTSVPLFAVMPWLARNMMLTGYISGGNRGPSARGLAFNICATGYTVAKDFFFTSNRLIIAFAAGVLLLVTAFFFRPLTGKLKDLLARHAAYIIYPVIYAVIMIALASVSNFDTIDTRLLMPIYPFMIILASIILITLP